MIGNKISSATTDSAAVPEKSKHRNKYRTQLSKIPKYFAEYCNNTTIHGFKYLGEKERIWAEKVWWLIIFSISVLLCAVLISKTYGKWEESPIITTDAPKPTPVWSIPYPAVTVCPHTKTKRSVFNYTDVYFKIKHDLINDTETLKRYKTIDLLCDDKFLFNTTEDIELIERVSLSIDDLALCMWSMRSQPCSRLFVPLLTENGVCFTFNTLNRNDMYTDGVVHHKRFMQHDSDVKKWSLEKGYTGDAGKYAFPRRNQPFYQPIYSSGLSFHLKPYEQDYEPLCNGIKGFALFLHHPAEMYGFEHNYVQIDVNKRIDISVTPVMVTTSKELESYAPDKRECYYSYERKLRFYKIYTKSNCESECTINFTLAVCNCATGNKPYTEDMRICGTDDLNCVVTAYDVMSAYIEIFNSKENITEIHDNLKLTSYKNLSDPNCHCLPNCVDLKYKVAVRETEFNREMLELYDPNVVTPDLLKSQLTRIGIEFKDHKFIASVRQELYGPLDFIANCGGLLGVFTGFSFLSIFEIFYFLTLRVWCSFRKREIVATDPETAPNELD